MPRKYQTPPRKYQTHEDYERSCAPDADSARLLVLEAENACLRSALAGYQEYADGNPLGGPASIFDAIAERIRAGEDYDAVLHDYGITHERRKDCIEIDRYLVSGIFVTAYQDGCKLGSVWAGSNADIWREVERFLLQMGWIEKEGE